MTQPAQLRVRTDAGKESQQLGGMMVGRAPPKNPAKFVHRSFRRHEHRQV